MKKKDSLAKLRKRIRDRNYRFSKLSKKRQRVMIAKDVLDMLAARKIKPRQGVYLEVSDKKAKKVFSQADGWADGWPVSYETGEAALQTQLAEVFEGTKCSVCAIGSVFVAAVSRADRCIVGDMEHQGDDNFMRDYLSTWFDREQLGLMEAAFESEEHFATDEGAANHLAEAAARTFERESAAARLRKIMENIVENGGKFVVEP